MLRVTTEALDPAMGAANPVVHINATTVAKRAANFKGPPDGLRSRLKVALSLDASGVRE
jgi:hypothetical protein